MSLITLSSLSQLVSRQQQMSHHRLLICAGVCRVLQVPRQHHTHTHSLTLAHRALAVRLDQLPYCPDNTCRSVLHRNKMDRKGFILYDVKFMMTSLNNKLLLSTSVMLMLSDEKSLFIFSHVELKQVGDYSISELMTN